MRPGKDGVVVRMLFRVAETDMSLIAANGTYFAFVTFLFILHSFIYLGEMNICKSNYLGNDLEKYFQPLFEM